MCFLLSFLQQPVYADIWGYADEKGVAHFAGDRVDERYEFFYRGGESFDISRGVKGASDSLNPAMQPAGAFRVISFFEISPNYKQVKHHLREASSAHQIDYELLRALIATESGFDAMVVSPNGAMGLMQLYTLLKPPSLTADKGSAPTRVRLEMQGGAARRGNMISLVQSMNPQPNLKTETD